MSKNIYTSKVTYEGIEVTFKAGQTIGYVYFDEKKVDILNAKQKDLFYWQVKDRFQFSKMYVNNELWYQI
jgi:hypothetical protein